MSRLPAGPLHIGQEVVLHDVNERRLDGPVKGEIVKIGRKLVTIKTRFGETQYRIEEQCLNSDWSSNGWFLTLEQEAAKVQLETDRETLRSHGFEERRPYPEPGTVHKVAEFLRSLDTLQQTS